jgi:outer membrane protein TolC
MMRNRWAFLAVLLLGVMLPAVLFPQAPPPAAVPLLTEQQAVEIARASNRQNRESALNGAQASSAIRQTESYFLPQSSVKLVSGFPLKPAAFSIPEGALGTFPGTGPVPGKNVTLSGGQNLTMATFATVGQPLSQLYKVHLALMTSRNQLALAQAATRAQMQTVTQQVRQAYHQICLLDVKVATDSSQLKYLEEAQAITNHNVEQGIALAADSLDAKTAVAQQRYGLLKDSDALSTAREQLNILMARNIDEPFTVEPMAAPSGEESELAVARATALRQRPEIREAKLQVEKANLDVRREKAEYLPNVSAQVTYVGFQNIDFLPTNMVTAGLSLEWENPWDWGRRRAKLAGLRDASKQQSLTAEDAMDKVLFDVNRKYRALQEARLLVEAAEVAKQASAERLRVVTNQFKQQSALLADVLKQSANDSQQAANLSQALATFWNARADFDLALGND